MELLIHNLTAHTEGQKTNLDKDNLWLRAFHFLLLVMSDTLPMESMK